MRTSTVKYAPLPLEPLLEQMRCIGHPATAAMRLDVSTATIHRWATTGIPYESCDRLAAQLGAHTSEFWPELWYNPQVRSDR